MLNLYKARRGMKNQKKRKSGRERRRRTKRDGTNEENITNYFFKHKKIFAWLNFYTKKV